MMKKLHKFLVCVVFCLGAFVNNHLFAQLQNITVADSLLHTHINDIKITGNKKTKSYIILREAQLKKGDSIDTKKYYDIIEQARQNIYNTTLFTEVKITTIAVNAFHVDLQIEVKERWYIYPTPQFKLVDRNFNEWKDKYNADLRRVIYGVKFAHYNISGRRDQLRLYFLNGYSRGFAASYNAPYSNNKLTEGFSVAASFTQSREINYKTSYTNNLQFYSVKSAKDPSINSFITKNISLSAAYKIRKGVFNSHGFGLGYSHLSVTDSISLKYNPNYFGNSKSTVSIVDLTYTYSHIKVNNVAYPLTGNSKFIALQKRGLKFKGGINMFAIEAGYNKFISLGKNWYISNSIIGLLKLPFKQAYINQRGIGFGFATMRGLELYAMDGVAYAINRFTLKKKIASFKVGLPFAIPFLLKKNEKIPFTFFAKTYTDLGYNYSKENATFLTNKMLYTGGFGIDMLTFYDIAIRFEYSFNQLNEKGLFLRFQSSF